MKQTINSKISAIMSIILMAIFSLSGCSLITTTSEAIPAPATVNSTPDLENGLYTYDISDSDCYDAFTNLKVSLGTVSKTSSGSEAPYNRTVEYTIKYEGNGVFDFGSMLTPTIGTAYGTVESILRSSNKNYLKKGESITLTINYTVYNNVQGEFPVGLEDTHVTGTTHPIWFMLEIS